MRADWDQGDYSVEQKLPPGAFDDQWHHLVWNYRGEELQAVYVDGELAWKVALTQGEDG